MLKRVDATDPNSTINLHDSDFEGTYDASSELMVKHADNSWPVNMFTLLMLMLLKLEFLM